MHGGCLERMAVGPQERVLTEDDGRTRRPPAGSPSMECITAFHWSLSRFARLNSRSWVTRSNNESRQEEIPIGAPGPPPPAPGSLAAGSSPPGTGRALLWRSAERDQPSTLSRDPKSIRCPAANRLLILLPFD